MIFTDEAQKHLQLLCEVAPFWLSEDTMHGRRYLKLSVTGSRDEAKSALLDALKQSSVAVPQ